MSGGGDVQDLLAQLRIRFDESFALPSTSRAADSEDVLALRLSGDSYAFRIRQAAGIFARRKVVPLAGAPGELVGICGVRGQVVPVFHLAALLGRPRDDEWRWLALSDGIGLTFDDLEGLARIPAGDFLPIAAAGASSLHITEAVRHKDRILPVLDLASLGAAIRSLARSSSHR